MPQKMLITNYNYSVSREEYENTINQIAQAFADVPGCLWKIWMIDEEKKKQGQ